MMVRRALLARVVAFALLLGSAPASAQSSLAEIEQTILSADGTPISARLFLPANPAGAPGIVITHGWGFNKESTFNDGRKYAGAGFTVITYTCRGFWTSGGLSTAAGDLERADQSAVIDWLIANTGVDADRLGVTGISYGAGHSYMAWVDDPRIKTAVPMQGWEDLFYSLFPGRVPKLAVGLSLYAVGIGGTQGRLDPTIHEWFAAGTTEGANDPDLEATEAAMIDPRSWGLRVDQVTDPAKSLFIIHSFPDEIFEAGQGLSMYERAQVPRKKILLTADGHGGVAFNARVQGDALAWFECMLRENANPSSPACAGVLNGDRSVKDPVTWAIAGQYRSAAAFPSLPRQTLYPAADGALGASPGTGAVELENVPGSIASFRSSPAANAQEILGAPEVTLDFTAAGVLPGTPRGTVQLDVRLLEVGGAAETEIASGVLGLRDAGGFDSPRTVTIRMRTASYRLTAGRSLELRVSNQNAPTYSAWREPGATTLRLEGSSLSLPITPAS